MKDEENGMKKMMDGMMNEDNEMDDVKNDEAPIIVVIKVGRRC